MRTIYKNGFTLIEIILVLGILSLIFASVTTFQVDVFKYNKYANDSLLSAYDARSILKVIVRELRQARTGSNGAYPIAEASTSSLIFFSDIDGDNMQEKIRYFIDGTSLKKGMIYPSGSPISYPSQNEQFSTLAGSISNSTSTVLFEYFDNNYSGSSSPLSIPVNVSDIRLVKINFHIDADPNRSPLPIIYSSQVMIRNLKDNL